MFDLTKIVHQFASLKVKSITDSLFQYGAILMFLGLLAAIFKTDNWVIITMFSSGGLFLVCGLFVYLWFSFKQPEFLRSESFQLKKQSLDLLGDNERSLNPHVKDIPLITNPYVESSDNQQNPMIE